MSEVNKWSSSFVEITASSGVNEKQMFLEALEEKSAHLKYLYDELELNIREYDQFEGYVRVEEMKEKQKAVMKEIEELSRKMNATANNLIG